MRILLSKASVFGVSQPWTLHMNRVRSLKRTFKQITQPKKLIPGDVTKEVTKCVPINKLITIRYAAGSRFLADGRAERRNVYRHCSMIAVTMKAEQQSTILVRGRSKEQIKKSLFIRIIEEIRWDAHHLCERFKTFWVSMPSRSVT